MVPKDAIHKLLLIKQYLMSTKEITECAKFEVCDVHTSKVTELKL